MSARTARRAYALASTGVGAATLAFPDRIWRGLTGQPPTSSQRNTVRLLGARHLGQAAAVLALPRNRWVNRAPVVDALHATSMAGLAWQSPRYRRPGLVSAVVASLFALVGAVVLRRRPG